MCPVSLQYYRSSLQHLNCYLATFFHMHYDNYKYIKQENNYSTLNHFRNIAISEELENHIEESKENYIRDGLEEKEAEEKAIVQMGNAEEIGKKLNKIH